MLVSVIIIVPDHRERVLDYMGSTREIQGN
jgi:hypothetical protein